MSSKGFAFLCLLVAVVVLIVPEVATRDLAPTSSKNNNEVTVKTNGVEDVKYGWEEYVRNYLGRGYYGGYPGRGGDYGGDYGGPGGYGRGPCEWGCCCYLGRCDRCCSYVAEVADAKP